MSIDMIFYLGIPYLPSVSEVRASEAFLKIAYKAANRFSAILHATAHLSNSVMRTYIREAGAVKFSEAKAR